MLWEKFRARQASPKELLASFELLSPPIDVRQLAIDLGIDLKFSDMSGKNYSGCASIRDGKAEIHVASGHVNARKRFTIAHEIGHLMLHQIPEDGVFRDDTFSGSPEEAEANNFAADLLVPLSMLNVCGRKFGYDVAFLANLFEVSVVTMEIRFVKLRDFRMGIT